MATGRVDPVRNFRFRLNMGSIARASFSEVTIGESSVEAIEYREGTDPPHARKLSGLTKYGNITLKAGITTEANSVELWKWFNDVSAGEVDKNRQKVTISVLDEAGEKEVAIFVVADAWPVKFQVSNLSGKGNEPWVQTLELGNEGIERAK